ncbi:MAG: dicarboxylate/amino acid:cation symporter [Rickettsiales bacterium]|nr:dicarboxylate/amino acid:cation symporter [Rickettsiales bacterium]
MKQHLQKYIFYSFLSGIILGILLNVLFNYSPDLMQPILNILKFGGDIFLKIIKMLVVPIVFFSLLIGVANLKNISALGRIGAKTLSLYLFTTMLAISLSLVIGYILNPGEGVNISVENTNLNINQAPSFFSVLLNIIPENPFKSLTEGNMLQVIFFSLILGGCLSNLKDNKNLLNFFNGMNELVLKMLSVLMTIAPIGIFCLISKTFATQGLSSILELIKYFFGVVLVIITHLFIVYIPLVKFLGKINIQKFFSGIKQIVLFAFSTSSSSATIPITLQNLNKNFNVKPRVSSFTVPLGATINMDGTAIMQGMATIFIANIYNIDLLFSDYLSIILTATLASVGTAGVPGVGIIMLGMVLNQVGLPLEGVAIVIGVDRLLDMLRTSLNVTGDAMVTLIVNKTEK